LRSTSTPCTLPLPSATPRSENIGQPPNQVRRMAMYARARIRQASSMRGLVGEPEAMQEPHECRG
jgi:hypothetical protein